MRLLDRYVVRNFLQVYLYCIAGFISIWLIFDISDNISTFIDEHIGLLARRPVLRHAGPASFHHSPAGFPPARAPFYAGANVACE